MTESEASIKRMKELMKERGLSHVFLKSLVRTTWPGRDLPYPDDRPYTIREVSYDVKTNDLLIWQHWEFATAGHYIESFEDDKVYLIERELVASINQLKKYTVILSASIDILATSPENARATVKQMTLSETKAKVYGFSATNEVKEK